MSRSIPWRSKPTQLITDMIQAAKQYKLYLVNETGPFSFVFKDQMENKFKVSISSTLKCSCAVVNNDHCIHTIFVLLKRFKVDENNPIIWQASYTDSELEGFLSFKYTKKTKAPIPKVKNTNFKKKQHDEDSDISEIGDEQTCPICYMDLKGECFTTCLQCKNHLHTKCFKVWVKHKQENGDKVTCPLCRNCFLNPMGIILRDFEKWSKKFTSHRGTKCIGCGLKNINGDIYHCLTCQNCNLCKNCYNHNQHSVHDKFLTKTTSKQAWRICKARNTKNIKKYLQVQKQGQDQKKQPTEIQILGFLIDSIPTLKQFQKLQANSGIGLNIIGNQMKLKNVCIQCCQPANDNIKRLCCSHTMHPECLYRLLRQKKYYCSCGEPFLPGYLSALGIKPIKLQTSKTEFKQTKKQLRKQPKKDETIRVSKPPILINTEKKMNHFRVRKSTNQKRPIPNNQIVIQINNMPIRARSLLR